MDLRWAPIAEDAPRVCSLELYASDAATSVPLAVAGGLAPLRDLTPHVSHMRQSDAELTVTLAWHDELYGASTPQPGQWLAARLNGTLLCTMLIEAVSEYRLRSGERSMSLVARSRDATSAWRDDPLSTPRYPRDTSIWFIVQAVAVQMGLDGLEVQLPSASSYGVPQAFYQASGIAAWDLISQCLLVVGYQPFVDALGQLRAFSRDLIGRAADVAVEPTRMIGFVGSKMQTPLDALRLKWRAPLPLKVSQAERVLGSTSVAAGFFARDAVREMYWSEDRTQQADLDPILEEGGELTMNSALFVKTDINRGVIDVGDQTFEPIFAEREDGMQGGCIGGRVHVDMRHFREGLVIALQAAKVPLAWVPDIVVSYYFGGFTVPVGRVGQAVADLATLILLCRMGVGVYEIKGKPYDLVNPVNNTTAFDPTNAPGGREESIESDLVADEAVAQAIVTREFVYRARSASAFAVTIVDDPRIEVGDIVELPDGTRILVTGYQRDLSPGSTNVLELLGFPA